MVAAKLGDLTVNPKHFLWAEKYRPMNLAETVMPEELRTQFAAFIASKNIPHLLFYAPESGVGKTTLAKILAHSIAGRDNTLYINASSESSIDVIRTDVMDFANTMTLTGDGLKIVILDEFERMGAQDAQSALRAVMEEAAKTCRFILTTNHLHKVIGPIQSRCVEIDFSELFSGGEDALKVAFFKRVKAIMKNEGITDYSEQVVANIIDKYYPDMRKCLNIIQGACRDNTMSTTTTEDGNLIAELFSLILDKKWKPVRQFIAERIGQNATYMYSQIFAVLEQYIPESAIPDVIVMISNYQFQDSLAADKEIPFTAMCMRMIEKV